MEKNQIALLPVVGPQGKGNGILHLYDILGKEQLKFNDILIEDRDGQRNNHHRNNQTG
jgi:hypothetical protein